MADANLYEDLKKALQDFKDFLHGNNDANLNLIKGAIAALKSFIPQIEDLLDKLIALLGQLKTEITNLDVGQIPGLSQLSTFTSGIKALLTTVDKLLPDQQAAIADVLKVVDVVNGLPSLGTVKQDILTLITELSNDLNSLK